jgi:hypothetical protein
MSEITDLAKTIREESEKTRALTEQIALGRREDGKFASKEEMTVAQKTLKKQDDQRALTKKMLGISERRMAKAEDLTNQIQAQEQIMAEQKEAAKESDIDIEKTEGYQKEQLKLDKLNAKKDDQTGASASEDAAKASAKDSKMMGYLKDTAGFLGGIAKQGMQKLKSGLGGLSKFLMGGLAVAALAFLNHPKFKEMIALLTKTIIPLLAIFYDEVLVPIGKSLAKLFKDIGGYLKDGDPSLTSILMDNKLAILGIITALAPNLVFGALKLAVTGLVKGVVLLSKSKVFLALKTQFALMKTALFAKLASLKAALVPLLPIIAIAAAIALVIVSLKKAFDDFKFELEATGSVWEATKTAIVSTISNIIGLPFDLLKDGVSWIIGKIGSVFGLESFTNASKLLDSFSFVDLMRDMLTFLGNSISEVFDGFMQVIQDFLRSDKLKFLGGGFAADALFGTKEDQVKAKKAKAEEQKQFELNRQALREKQKLEKATKEAIKLEKIKVEQNKLQVKKSRTVNSDLTNPATAQKASNIVSAPTVNNNQSSSSTTVTSTPIANTNFVLREIMGAA